MNVLTPSQNQMLDSVYQRLEAMQPKESYMAHNQLPIPSFRENLASCRCGRALWRNEEHNTVWEDFFLKSKPVYDAIERHWLQMGAITMKSQSALSRAEKNATIRNNAERSEKYQNLLFFIIRSWWNMALTALDVPKGFVNITRSCKRTLSLTGTAANGIYSPLMLHGEDAARNARNLIFPMLSLEKVSAFPAIWEVPDTELGERMRELDGERRRSIIEDAIGKFQDFIGCDCSVEDTGEPPITFTSGSCRCGTVSGRHNTTREDFLHNYKQAWDAIETFWLRVEGTHTLVCGWDPRDILHKFLTSLIEEEWDDANDKIETSVIPSRQCEFSCGNHGLFMERAAEGAENASLIIIALLEMFKIHWQNGAPKSEA